jgi:hypothetical protein
MTSLALFQAHYLSGEHAYSDLAWTTTGMTLRANPLSRSFVTGIGTRPPIDPLDRISILDDVEEPVRGMPSARFTWHLPSFREPYISVNKAYYYPAEQPVVDGAYGSAYPVPRRYIDSHALIPMNEGTICEAGLTAVTFLLMPDGSHPPRVNGTSPWTVGQPNVGKVYGLKNLPLQDVPLLFPWQIADLGGSIGQAPQEYLAAMTRIDAPTVPYWVDKLSAESAEALTASQIEAFGTWSLFTGLRSPLQGSSHSSTNQNSHAGRWNRQYDRPVEGSLDFGTNCGTDGQPTKQVGRFDNPNLKIVLCMQCQPSQ